MRSLVLLQRRYASYEDDVSLSLTSSAKTSECITRRFRHKSVLFYVVHTKSVKHGKVSNDITLAMTYGMIILTAGLV